MGNDGKHFRRSDATSNTEEGSATEVAVKPDEDPQLSETTQDQVGRSASLMSVLVLISRLTGFMRTWAQAYAIGVTVLASCYSVANNLPNSLYELVVAGMLTTAFLPVYMSIKEKSGRDAAVDYASNLTSIVLILMGAVTVLGFIFAAQLVWTQSFTASSEFDYDLTTWFFRFFVIEVMLYPLSSIFSGILNAERDYFWSSIAPIFNNVITTASFFAYAALADTNPQLALVILAIGNPLGVAMQVILQLPGLRKKGIKLRWRVDFHDPSMRETVRIAIPSFVVMIMSVVSNSFKSTAALSVTAVGASVSYYARLWYTLPYAILTVPITTAMFTELSDSWGKGDMREFKAGISSGMRQILYFMAPFMLYLMVFSIPLVSFLAAGGFSTEEIQMTAMYLAVEATSLPVYAISMYLQKVTSAMRQMKLYAIATAVGATIQVVLLMTLTPYLGLYFVPFTTTIFYVIFDVVLFVNLRKHLGQLGLRSVAATALKSLVIGVAGAAVGMGILTACNTFLGSCMGSTLRSFIYICLGGIPSLIVTYGLSFVLHMPETRQLKSVVSRFTRH